MNMYYYYIYICTFTCQYQNENCTHKPEGSFLATTEVA